MYSMATPTATQHHHAKLPQRTRFLPIRKSIFDSPSISVYDPFLPVLFLVPPCVLITNLISIFTFFLPYFIKDSSTFHLQGYNYTLKLFHFRFCLTIVCKTHVSATHNAYARFAVAQWPPYNGFRSTTHFLPCAETHTRWPAKCQCGLVFFSISLAIPLRFRFSPRTLRRKRNRCCVC